MYRSRRSSSSATGLSVMRVQVSLESTEDFRNCHDFNKRQNSILELIVASSAKRRVIHAEAGVQVTAISGADIANMAAFEIVDVLAFGGSPMRKNVPHVGPVLVDFGYQGIALRPIDIGTALE